MIGDKHYFQIWHNFMCFYSDGEAFVSTWRKLKKKKKRSYFVHVNQ